MGSNNGNGTDIDELVDRVGRQHRRLHEIADKLGHLQEEIMREIAGDSVRRSATVGQRPDHR